MKKKIFCREGVSAALLAVLAAALLLPLARLLGSLDGETVRRVISSSTFGSAIRGSLVSATLAAVLSVALAYFAALATERVKLPARGLFSVLLTLCMLVPSISNGTGLVILFGNSGILTRLFGLSSGIYGLFGIVFGSFLYAFPVAYLMLSDAIRYTDAAPYEAAKVLGLGRWRRFAAVTLPQLRRPLLSAFFAVFALVVTDYGVPQTLGGRYDTVSLVLYREAVGMSNYSSGAVYGCVLLVPAVLAFMLDLSDRKKGRDAAHRRPFRKKTAKGAKIAATAFCGVLSLVMLLPTVAFLLVSIAENYPISFAPTAEHFLRTFEKGAGQYLWCSVSVAVLAGLVGTAFSFFGAYMASRVGGVLARAVHLLSMASAAVPGLVLGLGYVLAFRGSAFMGTLAILVSVNGIHFLASPYLMMYNSFCAMPDRLEDTGAALGIGRARLLFGVLLPSCRGTLLQMFSYIFVNCMMTISAVSFLFSPAYKPVSMMLPEFEQLSQPECAAAVSLLILATNLAMRGSVAILNKKK